ncbi:LysR family transcriptional regulator [Streptomyces sp. CMB-StM0423]|uniref:LysR substrate-binding domain-containing protein n=1 Tax=Streptomyces sp. CMB-StM0423 TaxID=2059884 RepID=UPI000C709E2F|nr:LysR family transcriptional regulator [Streptomyces sp. CMB-StM0423]AUH41911.1 LysR family transcriptional regulator [Streptomyces sp. CMB-StM0423]
MDLLRHLRYFRAVAEERHFGRAAERLRIAQPSLSQRIRRLERELGVRLFDRGSQGTALTPAGRLVLAEADQVLAAADRLAAAVARIGSGAAGTLRAAVPPHLGPAAVAALITGYRERSPGGELELRELTTTAQARELAAGTLDAGVVRHPCPAPGLAFGPVLHQPLGVLLAAADPLAAVGRLTAADLSGRALVLTPRADDPALYDEVLTACARHGCTPAAVHEASGGDFTRALVLSTAPAAPATSEAPAPPAARPPDSPDAPATPGGAVALLPRTTAGPGTVWRPLAGEPIGWRTSAAWPADGHNPAVARFAEAAHEAMRDHAGMRPARAAAVHPRPASEFPL